MTSAVEVQARERGAEIEADPETAVAQLLACLLAEEAPLIQLCDQVVARLHLPRLPRHLSQPHQVAVLAHWLRTLDVREPRLFGLEREAGFRLAQLATTPRVECATVSPPGTARGPLPLVAGLDKEVLTPAFVHATVQAALLYAPVAGEVAQSLAVLAEELVRELRRRGVHGRRLRALRGEVATAGAVVDGLQGLLGRACAGLLEADRHLHTRERLRDWAAAGDAVVPPPSPHLPLRSHALWLHGWGLVEVAGGALASGASCFEQAFELYLQDEAFFGAGLTAVLRAATCLWRGQPEAAVAPLETSLQLLDLRGLFRLGDVLPWELVLLYARLGREEDVQREHRLLAGVTPMEPTLEKRVEAWLAWMHGCPSEARVLLTQARSEVRDAPTRRLLTVELAAWELRCGRAEAARTWLLAESSQAGGVSQDLQVLWGSVPGDLSRLPELAAAAARAQALPLVRWCPSRVGSLLSDHETAAARQGEVDASA